MKTFLLLAALLAVPAFAQDAGAALDLDAGVVNNAGVGVADAPMKPLMIAQPDGGMEEAVPAELVKTVFTAVKTGNWWLAASAFLVLIVGLLRSLGKKFHEWLPDDNILDKPLFFIFDTKIGAWILNWLTAIAGGVGVALAAGVQPDFSLWKSVLMVSTTGTMLVELYKDIAEWWKGFQEKKAAKAKADADMVAAATAAQMAAAAAKALADAQAAAALANTLPAIPAVPPKPGV